MTRTILSIPREYHDQLTDMSLDFAKEYLEFAVDLAKKDVVEDQKAILVAVIFAIFGSAATILYRIMDKSEDDSPKTRGAEVLEELQILLSDYKESLEASGAISDKPV